MSIRNFLLRSYFSRRERDIEYFRRHPIQVQENMLRSRIRGGLHTEFGWRYNLAKVDSVEKFQSMVEVFDYENFKPYIMRMFDGVRNVSTRGSVKLYARSSGTTSDRSKYLPITKKSLWWNHTLGMRDVATIYAGNSPKSKVFDGKPLTLAGSLSREQGNIVGDLSAVLTQQSTFWSGWFREPRIEVATHPDFERKAAMICEECLDKNITSIAGVPSWNLTLMRRVLEYTGANNILEVWPNMELFVHGGVEFTPYRKSFEEIFPSADMKYMETYNASEGFFAIADDPSRDDMLLMLDYGTFYEFRQGDNIVPLEGVKCGETYAMLITSNNGLWRYEIGDTVKFTSINPYRIRFAGRTRQYINVFGEELIVDNSDKALVKACEVTGAHVGEYSVAPCYMGVDKKGAHEWFVEFVIPPKNMGQFVEVLDSELRAINSDYDAKRVTTLELPIIRVAKHGLFLKWLVKRKKNKVPRLMNNRVVADDIMAMAQEGELV